MSHRELVEPLGVKTSWDVFRLADEKGILAFVPVQTKIQAGSDMQNTLAVSLLAEITKREDLKAASIKGKMVIVHRQQDGAIADFPPDLVVKIKSHI